MNIVALVENIDIDWHVSKAEAQLLMMEVDIPVWAIHTHAGFQYRLEFHCDEIIGIYKALEFTLGDNERFAETCSPRIGLTLTLPLKHVC